MNPMNEAWTLLKGVFKTIDLIARESKNLDEALQSMQESFPQISREEAARMIIEAKNSHSREAMSKPDFSYANNPNLPNMAHSSGRMPGQEPPKSRPNPLDLNEEELRRIGDEE